MNRKSIAINTFAAISLFLLGAASSNAQVIPQGNSYDPNAFVYDQFLLAKTT